MSGWAWAALAVGAVLIVWAGLVVGLVLAGRRADARAVATFVPECAALFGRLLRDPELPRRRRLVLGAVVLYLAIPFDVVPDFLPVAGQLDDAVVVALALRAVLRGAGPDLVRRHWRGSPQGLAAVLRLAGEHPALPADPSPG